MRRPCELHSDAAIGAKLGNHNVAPLLDEFLTSNKGLDFLDNCGYGFFPEYGESQLREQQRQYREPGIIFGWNIVARDIKIKLIREPETPGLEHFWAVPEKPQAPSFAFAVQ
ncbi:Uncharacterized protein Adt_33017 [Abeliophyllum distichum]|uniref:Uncharacterized protein n=1 Tax=Abeliophyllum distichum TaxID=126358 RepID=A0ABD1QV15_9LAMI